MLRLQQLLFCGLLCLLLYTGTLVVVTGEEATAAETATTAADDSSPNETASNADEEVKKTEAPKKVKFDKFDVTNEDWGSYYDPQGIFCGKFDCYKILGFDYESFGDVKPSTKEITKRYRKLSREWHPDKSKHKNAKERFVKIARAYEVLTNRDQRTEYDSMRYDQDAYFKKYGTSVLWSYAPKTDVTFVVLLVLLIGNVMSWFMQKHRWNMVADRLIEAAVQDWTPRDGGTPESKQIREEALAVLAKREAEAEAKDDSTTGSTNKQKKKAAKLSAKERKKQEQETLLPIVTEIVNTMHDFGGGFHKPTWKDLLIVTIAKFPFHVASGVIWQTKYYIRRLQNLELNEEEQRVLTERAVGPVTWNSSTEDDKVAMIQRALWKKDNFASWNEEQEIKKLSAAEQKQYMKMKKKGKVE